MNHPNLIQFLQDELHVSAAAIDLAMKNTDENVPLPMMLWLYGFVTVEQVDEIYHWLHQQRLASHR